MSDRERVADAVKLILSWLVVAVPAAWGIVELVAKSTALFR